MSSAKEKPNVLMVLVDNQWAGALGCYGNTEHRTPNLDRLAREGVRYSRAFCTNGLCSPTRASILTGLMPSQHGVHEPFNDDLSMLPEDWVAIREWRTLPLTLKNRGYQTAMVGKWHLGQFRKPALGFEYWVTFPRGHTVDFYDNVVIDNGNEYPVKDRHLVDFWAEKAAEYIDNYDGKKPFYLQVNFNGPYVMPPSNFGPDPRNPFYKQFEGQSFEPIRHRFSEKLMTLFTGPYEPDVKQELNQKTVEDMAKTINRSMYDYVRMHNDPETRANIAAQNAMVDHGAGVVTEALKRKGLEEDTLVIYLSDHGMPYGHHGLWTGASVTYPAVMYDQNFHIPLIMRHTGKIETNRTCDLLVSQYDLMTTILDYVGFPDVKILNSPGRSFASALRGDTMTNWTQEVYFEHEESRGMRTSRYSYWKRHPMAGQNELYDLVTDPEENTNVYGQTQYDEITRELDAKVTAFFARYSDPRYDLWKGGTAKLISYRPTLWTALYGKDWKPSAELKPPFTEQ